MVVLLCMAAPLSSFAGENEDYQAGVRAYQAKDYATALKYWKPLAEQGIAQVQYNLGVMYKHGRGVAQSDTEAVKWSRKAANQGHAGAQ